MDAALGCPNRSTQILELRTLFISSRLAADAEMLSREGTTKQSCKLLDLKTSYTYPFKLTPSKSFSWSDKRYVFGLSLETKNQTENFDLTWTAEFIPAS